MVVSKCPLRVSLCGGSTDSPLFIKKYGIGKVISFTPSLYTYVTFHKDVNGFNNYTKKYIVSYSKLETCTQIKAIKNDVVRVVLDFFDVNPLKVSLDADVFSFGSGLASSSSYILNLISGINSLYKFGMDPKQVYQLAFKLESRINPLTGYQDTYGCGMGGFKLMEFDNENNFKITLLPTNIFDEFDFYLVYTNIQRESTKILESLDLSASQPLLDEVDNMHCALANNRYEEVFATLNRSWAIKKQTSDRILDRGPLLKLDSLLEENDDVCAHKLCGAGGGGYFLVISHKNKKIKLDNSYPYIRITVDYNGIDTQVL
jgi:D-glycero-alpha-D-manno-heptose-7-phosphate kinase